MERRFHGGFTAAEKTELWDRWKRGELLKAMGRAFGKESSSIYFLVAPHGGIRPAEQRPPVEFGTVFPVPRLNLRAFPVTHTQGLEGTDSHVEASNLKRTSSWRSERV
jgi:hypothetical protein